ncbi:hypothetical protein RND81_11G110400 [Saponaria officinalis]|uniref:PHD-type domain-containing protein n=1 Tax=Saponaria officinalis TaxID=3572 RepID=A0AAW1HKQ2_SAPOF
MKLQISNKDCMAGEGDVNDGRVEVTSSKAKASHKRELQFAVESLHEIGESMSRLRTRKRVAESNPEVVEVVDVDEARGGDKRKEKVRDGVPSKLKDLLLTGLLEGFNVWYLRGIKGGIQLSKGLAGTIKGTGILCFCEECMGSQIISPNQFELHAGSANKRPANHIYLDNHKSLRDVLNACKHATLDGLTAAIRTAISSSPQQQSELSPTLQEPIHEASAEKMTMDFGSSFDLNAPYTEPEPMVETTETSDKSLDCVILPSPCTNAPKPNSSSTNKSQGKITRRDLRQHKVVFYDDVLPDGTELGYYLQGKKLLTGYKFGSGICCGCCDTVISPSQFEAHAGFASRRKPYFQIYTSNGMSLHEISVKLSAIYGIAPNEKDDLCSVCRGVGVNLLGCDRCPRVYHFQCVALSCMPNGTWYCKLCGVNFQLERVAEQNQDAIAAGREPGIDPMEQIINRCLRYYQNHEPQETACALCRVHDFCESGFGPRTVMICDQCEKEYHVCCLKEHNMQDLKELPEGNWFCSYDCEAVNSALNDMLQKGDQSLPDDLLNLVKNNLTDEEFYGNNPDIRWRVLNGKKCPIDEVLPFLSKAVSVFHEKFDPIYMGKRDLIPHMVYGWNAKDTEFAGMYCVVLSVNSIIVCAAVFRPFCKDVVEIPLIATSKGCERKGYFQCLYLCIEKFFENVGVRNLFLPAAEETRSMWINKFGFNVLPPEILDELTKLYPIMHFDGTSILHKRVTQLPALALGCE